jgi:hypothetical protein
MRKELCYEISSIYLRNSDRSFRSKSTVWDQATAAWEGTHRPSNGPSISTSVTELYFVKQTLRLPEPHESRFTIGVVTIALLEFLNVRHWKMSFFNLLIRLLGYFNDIKGGASRCLAELTKTFSVPIRYWHRRWKNFENNNCPPRTSDKVD